MPKRWHEFIFEISAPNRLTARSRACGIAGLNHEAFDHPMEYVRIVIAIATVHTEILNRFRAFGCEELHMNVTQCRMNRGIVVELLGALAFGYGNDIFLGGFLVEDISVDILQVGRQTSTVQVESGFSARKIPVQFKESKRTSVANDLLVAGAKYRRVVGV